MNAIATFRSRLRAGDPLLGTFVKTAGYQVVEVLGGAGMDFAVLDAPQAEGARDVARGIKTDRSDDAFVTQ